MLTKHLDEAKRDAVATCVRLLRTEPGLLRLVLIEDLFAKFRLVLWPRSPEEAPGIRERVGAALSEAAGAFWTNDVWDASEGNEVDRLLYEGTWTEGQPEQGEPRLRLNERRRSRSAWFERLGEPPWKATGTPEAPPVVVFYSFKGGVGRTTSLASFALRRARAGERVVVIDFDLDAPGAGTLLAADDRGTTAAWGTVDYLLERPVVGFELRDYYHACRREALTGRGEILVIPAGHVGPERDYLGKLARVDLDSRGEGEHRHTLFALLDEVRTSLAPNWILLDSRSGLSDAAGLLLSGLGHLHVLFGTTSPQSWQGLRVVLERVGASRVRESKVQLDCLIVQSMVPQDSQAAALSTEKFRARSEDAFREHYYAADPENPEDDQLWYVRDLEASDAPHVPIPVSYDPRLAHFDRLEDVANFLVSSTEYGVLEERISERFAPRETDLGDS